MLFVHLLHVTMLKGRICSLLSYECIANHSFHLKTHVFENIQRNLLNVEVQMHEPFSLPSVSVGNCNKTNFS